MAPPPIDTLVMVCMNCQEYRPHFQRIRGEWRETVCYECQTVAKKERVKAPTVNERIV
jgi:hypothetical protein